MKILVTGTAGFTPLNKIRDFNAERIISQGPPRRNQSYTTPSLVPSLTPGITHKLKAKMKVRPTGQKRNLKVQSSTYPNYSFVRMNLEDREQPMPEYSTLQNSLINTS